MSYEEIKQLDIAERILLVEDIWDSIANEEEKIPVSHKTVAILEERLALLQKNRQTVSWREIIEQLNR